MNVFQPDTNRHNFVIPLKTIISKQSPPIWLFSESLPHVHESHSSFSTDFCISHVDGVLRKKRNIPTLFENDLWKDEAFMKVTW